MSFQRFKDDELSKPEKSMVLIKSITNYVMGVFFIGLGIAIFFPPAILEDNIKRYDELAIQMLGVILIIYGIFRVYRGYRKNYFRES